MAKAKHPGRTELYYARLEKPEKKPFVLHMKKRVAMRASQTIGDALEYLFGSQVLEDLVLGHDINNLEPDNHALHMALAVKLEKEKKLIGVDPGKIVEELHLHLPKHKRTLSKINDASAKKAMKKKRNNAY